MPMSEQYIKTRAQLDFICAGSSVRRFHTTPTLQTETVGHHSFMVAWLCWLLDRDLPTQLTMSALAHDLAEHIVGDIPAPTKRKLGLNNEISTLEKDCLDEVGLSFDISNEFQRTLKLADVLSSMLFCCQERQLGNRNVDAIYARSRNHLKELGPLSEIESLIVDIVNDKWLGVPNG